MQHLTELYPLSENSSGEDSMNRLCRKKFNQFLVISGQSKRWPRDRQGAYLVPNGTGPILQWLLQEAVSTNSDIAALFDKRKFKALSSETVLSMFEQIRHKLVDLYFSGQIGDANCEEWIGLFAAVLQTEQAQYIVALKRAFSEFCEHSLPLAHTIDVGSITTGDGCGHNRYVLHASELHFQQPEDLLDTDRFVSQADFLNGLLHVLDYYTQRAKARSKKDILTLAECYAFSDILVEDDEPDDEEAIDNGALSEDAEDFDLNLDYTLRDLNIQKYLALHPDICESLTAECCLQKNIASYFQIISDE